MNYIIICKSAGSGYSPSKYADMFNIGPIHGAYRFDTKEEAEKICNSLIANGHKGFYVTDVKTAAQTAIKQTCERGENAEVCDMNQYLFRNLFQSIESYMKMLKEADKEAEECI